MERHIASVRKSPVPFGLSPQLVSLAVQCFTERGIKATLCNEAGITYLCCCSPDVLTTAIQYLNKPFVNTIPLEGEKSIDAKVLQERCGSTSVIISLKGDTVVVEGFKEEQVQSATKHLQSELAKRTTERTPLSCSLEQQLYLNNLITKKPEMEGFKRSLPATVSCWKGKIYLKGTVEEREASSKALIQSIPPHHRSVSFNCHMSFYHLIEKHVLKGSSLERIRDGVGSAPSKKEFKIVLFGHQVEQLEAVHSKLQVLYMDNFCV